MFIGIDVNGAPFTPTLNEVKTLCTSYTLFEYNAKISCLFSGVGEVNEIVSDLLGFLVLGDTVFVSNSGSPDLTPLSAKEAEGLGLALFSAAIASIEKMSPLLLQVS